MKKVPTILTVEGIIASGKTTLLSKVKSRFSNYKIKIIPEPIAAWENTTKFKPEPLHFVKYNKLFNDSNGLINGDNSKQQQFQLLSEMYKDPQRWCLSFQLWALYTRIKSIEYVITMNEDNEDNEDIDFVLIERSSMANRIFAESMYDNNYLNECEWLMYNHMFDYFNEKNKYLLDGIIYLNCPVNITMNRINIRNRKGENNVTYEYQTELQNKHNQWLFGGDNHNYNVPLFEIGVPYDEDVDNEKETFENLNHFMLNIESKNQSIDVHDLNQQKIQRL